MISQFNNEDLEMWTVYDHPLDFPDCFVARMHTTNKGPTEEFITGATLEEVETKLHQMTDYILYFIPRHATDDSVIVGTWL